MKVTILSPDRLVHESDAVDLALLPAEAGDVGVLPDHTPLLTPLRIGAMELRSGEHSLFLAVAGGFAEVTPEAVRVIADAAEDAESIDVPRAREAKTRAEEKLRAAQRQAGEVDVERARLALHRAVNRLRVAGAEDSRGA